MNNKTLLAVLGGCAVLLMLCLCVGIAGAVYFDAPTQISRVLGLSTQKPLPTSLPSAKPTVSGSVASPTRAASSSASGSILDALGKNKTATKFQIETSMLIGSTTAGQYKEESFLDFAGKVDGKNVQLTSRSGLFNLLAGGGELEIIQADGKTYMRGIKLGGLTDPKVWYVQKDSSMSVGDFANASIYDDFTKGTKPGDFQKVRTEVVDTQPCDVYLYNAKTLQGAGILGALGSAQAQDDLGTIDKADITFSLCLDGYVHRALVDYAGHNTKNVNEKGALKMTMHMWDYNNSTIVVAAPKDPKPMPGQ